METENVCVCGGWGGQGVGGKHITVCVCPSGVSLIFSFSSLRLSAAGILYSPHVFEEVLLEYLKY